MTELSVHQGKVIFIHTDKVISKEVIKDTQNKLTWRHLLSYLPEDVVQVINQQVYQFKMTKSVLQIGLHFDMRRIIGKEIELNDIICDVYDCHTYFTNLQGAHIQLDLPTEETRRRHKKQIEEKWIWIDYPEDENVWSRSYTLGGTGRVEKPPYIQFFRENEKKLGDVMVENNPKSKNIQKNKSTDRFNICMEYMCKGLLANGQMCGCGARYDFIIPKEYYKRNFTDSDYIRGWQFGHKKEDECWLRLCGRHIKKYEKADKKEKIQMIDQIYKNVGLEVKHGIVCKTC